LRLSALIFHVYFTVPFYFGSLYMRGMRLKISSFLMRSALPKISDEYTGGLAPAIKQKRLTV
ncbi:MAG: hypothetical protein RR463_09365, partial [Hydrogenoanaerobacterium sp.]